MVPIIDAHTHFFDPARPAGVPWPAADDEVLYRTTLPEHFRAVASPHGVHQTVVVEASAWLEDNQWILDLAARDSDRSIVGFVGHIEPDDPDYTSHLDRFCANPLFRGLRLSSALVDGPRDALVEACRELLQRDLSVDLLVNGEQLSVVAELCAALPDLHVVLDHVAHVAIDGAAPNAGWLRGVEALADSANVYCKISGLVECSVPQQAPENADFYRPTLDALWRHFGDRRLLYASNWPVCGKRAPYAAVFGVVDEYLQGQDESVRERVLGANTVDAYRLSSS